MIDRADDRRRVNLPANSAGSIAQQGDASDNEVLDAEWDRVIDWRGGGN
jgi:hypothetical protein